MEDKFDKYAVHCYSNFMKYTISNAIYNLILVILENSTILFIIDLMFNDKILGEALTPLYFLSPHLYLDILNEQFPNECNIIFTSNTTSLSNSTTSVANTTMSIYHLFNNNTPTSDIVFFGNTLYSLQNSYCIYSSKLIISIISILLILTFFMVLLFLINSKGKINPYLKTCLYLLTNSINLFLRPFFVIIIIILINRPIVYLYHSSAILPQYHTEILIYTMVSLFFLIYAVIFTFINIKYINNVFFFESLPYDYFSNSESLVLLIIKIVIGLKVSYDKLLGLNEMSIMNLIIGVLIFVRVFCTVGRREYVVNHVYLKNLTAFLTFFYSFYILLKLLNEFMSHLKEYTVINFTMEIILIIIILVTLTIILFTGNTQFVFRKKSEFMIESMQFMYYVYKHLGIGKGYDVGNYSHSHGSHSRGQTINQHSHSSLQELKIKREIFIDNVIIGHKMKCRMEDCILCCEDIYNPDLKTLCLILYQQFLHYEKEYKEENEGMTLLIKLMYLKMIDERKIHRIAYTILKNIKNKNISFATMLKINYMYETNLYELNHDLRGLLTIKYGEFNDELLQCIKNFEDILGFIKSKTEKVELVTNKTNQIGLMYSQLINDLHYLKKNKRIYFDPVNLLQIICVLRMVFPRALDHDITANLDYNFIDFLEVIDQVFIDNISFLVRYDFNNRTWRIKKIPKIFIDMTKYRISELLDQSLEKIFPKILSKSLIKKMEEKIILFNMNDSKLEFKTVISDKESNARYVKFVIDIIPHLENNYMMFMQCHFHRRQLLIIDEFGSFINGSHVLYEKVGINADIVAASKGRINMYTMFNLDKKQKLDDITIVSIALEGVVDATRKLFLLDAEDNNKRKKNSRIGNSNSIQNTAIGLSSGNATTKKQTTLMPNFLDSFIKNEVNAIKHKKPKIVVFLHLFSTETINDIKYHVYNIRISNPDDKVKENKDKDKRDSKSGPRYTVAMKRINTDFSNSSEDKELLKKTTTLKKKQTEKNTKDHINNDDNNNNDHNSSLNNFNYYYAFLDSQHSMSMTMNYKSNLDSYNTSQAASITTDVFSYLYMKSINSSKSQSNKFEAFILSIFLLNILLVLFGLSSIIYIQAYSSDSFKLLNIINDFYTMNGRIFKSTNVIFSFLKYNQNDSNFIYQNYISNKYQLNEVKYDTLIHTILDYDLSKALSNITSFTSNSFNYFGVVDYNSQLNYETLFIHLDPSGEYTIKSEKMKYIIDLFTLTMNQLANKVDVKLFFNISFMEYDYLNKDMIAYPQYMKLKGIDPSLLDKNDKSYFNDLINLYQHFFNYFSGYIVNFNGMQEYIYTMSNSHFIKVHISSKALLIVILLLNVIFLVICMSSVLIYQSILKMEFRGLYGISEDTIGKLKEKFQYVKELIKWEQAPSLVYNKIRKMREDVEQMQIAEMKKMKKKEKEALNQNKTMNMNIPQAQTNNDKGNDDTISIMTTGSQAGPSSDYLRFSGAVKGLFRSSTLRAKEQLKKLSKETRKQKASQDLLNRLNFSFEMTKNFIIFIILMSFLYLILGIISIIINDSNFNNIKESLSFNNQFYNKFFNLFNFYSGVKLSIILNQNAPYTIYNNTYTPQCSQCIFDYLSNYSSISGQLYTMEYNEPKFISVYNIEQSLQGDSICTLMYSTFKNNLNDYIKSKSTKGMLESLTSLCFIIPILKSNIDTIFNEIIIEIRKVYNVYLASDRNIMARVELLSNDFIESDLLMTMFVHFYYEYITENSILILNSTIVQSFYSFVMIIFSINMLIDLFMIVFIWFKIYRQIIASVKNVQLVNEAVSVI